MHRPHNLPARLAPGLVPVAIALCLTANAQVPVDADGEPYDFAGIDAVAYPPAPTIEGARIESLGDDSIPMLSSRDLEDLVGPVALYPDNLLAVVLPAAAYPLQIVQAARFLAEVDEDPTQVPSRDWDESVVALLNYPEVLRQLNDDIDWTLRLGEGVIAQQADVLAAVQRFRDRAYVAGNLESDARQSVVRENSIIEITPVDESTIYVPAYRPERVVHYSAQPVYSYYPDPCPVYYYPYSEGHAFRNGFFWGVTSAYSLGWQQRRLRVLHHSFSGHPYFSYRYPYRWWYRRPTLVYHNSVYYRPDNRRPVVRNRVGDHWAPRYNTRTPRASRRSGRSATTLSTDRRAPYPRAVSRTSGSRPSIDGVSRGLREQGARRRGATPAITPSAEVRPQRAGTPSVPTPSRSRTNRVRPPSVTPAPDSRSNTRRSGSNTTRRPDTPSRSYQRREPHKSPVSSPRHSTQPRQRAPVAPPSRSTPSRSDSSRSDSSRAATGGRSSTPERRSRSTTRRFDR